MAAFAANTECTVMFVVFLVASEAIGRLPQFVADRSIMAIDTFKIFMLLVYLEIGFIVIEIPSFPVTRVVTIITTFPECAFMHILLFVT